MQTSPCVSPCAALLLYLTACAAAAQNLPNAGSLQRETERSLQAPEAPVPIAPAPAAPEAPSDAPRVLVQAFVIEGAQLIEVSALQAVLAPYVGQSLTMAQLQQATAQLETYYRQQDWYARALLPQQDVTQGQIRIQILESRWGQSHLMPTPSGTVLRANAPAVQRLVTTRLQPGQPLSNADLERGLLLANDLPGIEASGVLSAGQQIGLTDLYIRVLDVDRVTGDIGLSNYGLRYTGKAQLSGGLALNNLHGRGDQLSLRVLGSAHLGNVQLRYSWPVGYDGMRLSGWASYLGYRLAGSYAPLQAEGSAWNYGLALSYPLLRREWRNLVLEAGLQQRRFSDDLLQTPSRRQHVNTFSLGLNGNLRDARAAGAYSWGSVQWSTGQLRITDVNGAIALDAAGPRTRGSYHKLAGQVTRLQNLGGPWQAQASAAGQWSNRNLASSERMSLGGPDQVRAYPINEAVGDHGLLLKLQLMYALAHGWQAQLFYDWGRIRQYHQPWSGWNAGSGQPNTYQLAGWGIGLAWQGQGSASGWRMQASIATPSGSNAGHQRQRNSDGSSLRSTRGWMYVGYSF